MMRLMTSRGGNRRVENGWRKEAWS